jgi:hypothetical protein
MSILLSGGLAHQFLTMKLDRDEWSAQWPGCYIPKEEPLVPSDRRQAVLPSSGLDAMGKGNVSAIHFVLLPLTAILVTGAAVNYYKELFMHLPRGTGTSLEHFGQQASRPYLNS